MTHAVEAFSEQILRRLTQFLRTGGHRFRPAFQCSEGRLNDVD